LELLTWTKVPIEEMADAQEGRVILKCTKRVFEKMPSYVERQFFPAPVHAKGSQPSTDVVWDVSAALAAAIGRTTGLPVPLEHFRKAKFERHILNDAPVWRQEPHQKLGEVERLLSDEIDDEIQALVVRRGEFFAKEVVLPIDYVTEVMDGVVRVQIADAELESLEEFKPD
jgi:hypothetical protein